MEYDARKIKPESNRKFLVQQVNEQSNLCDVIVKMGLWEKKFHRCVLVISPFFDHVLNDNFLEGQTAVKHLRFEIPKCTTYIEEHLPEMLLMPQMVNLTKDSIHLLFSDKRLSYVQMDDKLLFLLKWLNANPNTRKGHMKELLSNIDFHSISNQCLKDALNNTEVACHIHSEHMTTARSNDYRALIMKDGYYGNIFWCLDLERDQWFRVESNSLKVDRMGCSVEISGTCTKTTGSIVCSVGSYPETSFVLLDLPKDACTKFNFTASEEEVFSIKQPENIKFCGHVCIVFVNKQIERMQHLYDDSSSSNIYRKLRIMSLMGPTLDEQLFARQMIENRLSMSHSITTSTLYIGQIGDSNVELSPLVSFKDDGILRFAISESSIAIIFNSRTHVAFYDLNEGQLERKNQTTSYGDEIAPIKEGFVIYDNKRCITFTRMQGACLSGGK